MIRAHLAHRACRVRPISALLLALVVAGCGSTTQTTLATIGPDASPSAQGHGSASPDATATEAPGASVTPAASADPGLTGSPTGGPTASATGCTGSESNLAFFAQAAAGMSWSVYCAVLPDGWYLETGSYRLANEGHMEVTYRGPGDAHMSIAEGNICLAVGGDIEQCAPRDTVLADAAMGDLIGELGRLSNGLVLDVDRGGNPSWRVIGLGISVEEFTAIGAAMIKVPAAP